MDEVLQYEQMHLADVIEKIQEAADSCERDAKSMAKEISSFICVDYEDRAKLSSLYKDQKKLYAQAEKYAGFLDSPYFGRMDFDVPILEGEEYRTESYYIGKEDISTYQAPNDKKKEQLVIDWRSPIGECYYLRNQRDFVVKGSKISLVLKRAFDISKRKLKTYKTEYDGTTVSLEGDVVDSFLLTVLKDKRRVNRLTDIIRTIQANQNEIIRKPFEMSFIVQGCAGSGKTMILLHRLSTILYNNRGLSAQGIKIITPNRFFDMHINALSRELGVDEIERFSVEEYYSYLIHKFDRKIDVRSEVESEKAMDPEMLRYIYSSEYSDSMRDLYQQLWHQMLDRLSASGFQSYLEKAKTRYPEVQTFTNDTYEKLIAAFTTARLAARERNKAWKEARQNAVEVEERVNNVKSEIDEINKRLPQIVEDTKKSLQDSMDNNEAILKQLDDQISDIDNQNEELSAKAELEEQHKKAFQGQLDDIENNREQLCDCSSVPGVSVPIKRVIMERERDLILRYHQTQRELNNLAVFRVGKRRELLEQIGRISDQYRQKVAQFLDTQKRELQVKIDICSGRTAEIGNQVEENNKAKGKLINRKQAKDIIGKTVAHAYEELTNYPYRDFTSVFSSDENVVLAPLFYQLNITVKSLLEHEKRLKAANDRLVKARIVAEEKEKVAFSDNEIKELDRCGRIVDQVSFSNLSRNVLFRKLLSVYQQYNQEYKRYNYRHKLYLRLLLCSMYYSRGVSSDRFINIDEAQDLSVAEYRLLSTILGPRCVFNLYGDTNQNVYSYKGISSWDEIRFITDQVYELNENYRNTLQITKFCNEEFGTSVYPIGVSGKEVVELDLLSAVDCIVAEKKNQKKNRCAILYRYGVQAIRESLKVLLDESIASWSNIDEERVCVLTVEQAKGLEFDSVVVITDHMTNNEKYIAYTRALDTLIVVRDVFESKIEEELTEFDEAVLEEEISLEDDLGMVDEQGGNASSDGGSSLTDSQTFIMTEDENEIASDVTDQDSTEAGSLYNALPKVDVDLKIVEEIEASLSEKFGESVVLTEAQRIIATLLDAHENVIYVAPAGNRKSLLLNWFAYKMHHEIKKQTIISADSHMQENLLVLAEQAGLRAGVVMDMESFHADFSKEKYDIVFVPLDFFNIRSNVEKFIEYFTGRVSYWGIDNPSMENGALQVLIECGAAISCAMYIMLKPGNNIPEIEGFKAVEVEGSANTVPVKKINLISVEDKKRWIIENTHLLVGQGIIYCNDEDDCSSICKALRKKKIKAEAYIQIEQEENVEKINYLTATFTQGGLPIIATTHETGKNLTNPNLRFIIHYDIPERNVYKTHVGQLAYSPDSIVYDLMVRQAPGFEGTETENNVLTSEGMNDSIGSERVIVSESKLSSGKNIYHETQEGTYRSWTVLDQETAVKTCDDDFIFGNASGVPKGMCGFFDAEDFVNGQYCELKFIYEKQVYSASVSADYTPSRRIKIRWDAILGREFKRLYKLNSITKVSFHRCGEKTYELIVE